METAWRAHEEVPSSLPRFQVNLFASLSLGCWLYASQLCGYSLCLSC